MGKLLTVIGTLLLLGFSQVGLAQLDRPAFSSFSQQSAGQQIPLPLEQAFPYFVSELSPGKYRVSWNLAAGHYLYRHAFQFTFRQSEDSETLEVEYSLPNGIQKTDQFFGQIEAYYNQVSVDLELTTVPGPNAVLIIQYQGCADWGFCYPPQRAPFPLVAP